MEFAGRRMRRDDQSPLPIEQEFRILSAGVTGEWAGRRPPSKLDYRQIQASGPNRRGSRRTFAGRPRDSDLGGIKRKRSPADFNEAFTNGMHRRFLAPPYETQLEPKQNMVRWHVLW
jgi:hypothetical protein